MDGKQVAVLVPTTVLAQQHYQTFSTRFEGFGPVVDVVCRFRSQKEQKSTCNRVETGQVDILIGTHSILNDKHVKFKNLGLLIVDEEQRFGVTQKEKIKKISKNIDVLTLSATPIPRTLHMSLVGARDMSIIETPPEERFPVQTYVVENNDAIIRDAIKREIKRGGQVYFVYNRVETIDKMRAHLADMLPDIKIQTAHGQMPEEILEQVMLDFYEGEYDMLVATSIIENGLDVANANTIIIYDADRFGLSQLYQMRGRVGRSNQLAFAYFIYQADKVLTEVAEKRLQAIKEFAELGAGFKIAMRDLEIRGAGNLLGSQQHGHIASVGFEMYCRLLEEAVEALKTGKPPVEKVDPVLEIKVEAYIDGDYITDAMHKIEIYQRIAAIRTNEDIRTLLDELIDRFGDPLPSVLNLLSVARIKNYARNLGIKSIVEKPMFLEILFGEQPNLEIENVLKLKTLLGEQIKFIPGPPGIIRFQLTPLNRKKILNYSTRILMTLAGEEIKNQTNTF
jgi:transcription-repair coupling factor (superfamily II helicase)